MTTRKVKLKDGRVATVVDTLGEDFVVDVGTSLDDWDTIIVSANDIDRYLQPE